MPATWIERVMRAESAGQTILAGRPIRSRAGAIGLMQLMPATWAEMRARLALGPDPDDPRDNILAGTAYLRLMYDRFGYPGLFAAYHAGPARYARHLATGRPLPGETRAYLAQVAGVGTDDGFGSSRRGEGLEPAVDSAERRSDTPPRDRLFALRSDATASGHASADMRSRRDDVGKDSPRRPPDPLFAVWKLRRTATEWREGSAWGDPACRKPPRYQRPQCSSAGVEHQVAPSNADTWVLRGSAENRGLRETRRDIPAPRRRTISHQT
jgi:hypothetical protein